MCRHASWNTLIISVQTQETSCKYKFIYRRMIWGYRSEWGKAQHRNKVLRKHFMETSHIHNESSKQWYLQGVWHMFSHTTHTHTVSVIDHHVWEVLIKYMAPPISSWAQNRATELYDMTGWRLRAVSISNEVTPQFQHSFDHFSVSWFQI